MKLIPRKEFLANLNRIKDREVLEELRFVIDQLAECSDIKYIAVAKKL